MKIGILVNEGPFTHQTSDSAYQFASAALKKGHEITRVFFYHDGVNNSNKLSEPQSDDRNLVQLWSEMAEQNGVELIVCVAAAFAWIDDGHPTHPILVERQGVARRNSWKPSAAEYRLAARAAAAISFARAIQVATVRFAADPRPFDT